VCACRARANLSLPSLYFFSEVQCTKPGVLVAIALHAVRVLFPFFLLRVLCGFASVLFASVPPLPGPFFRAVFLGEITYVPFLFISFIYGSVFMLCFSVFLSYCSRSETTYRFLRALPF